MNPDAVYDLLLSRIDSSLIIDQMCLGLTWTYCRTSQEIGFAQSPGHATRILEFPGTVSGRPVAEVANWLRDWNPFTATVGLAAVNSAVNTTANEFMQNATLLSGDAPANLAVFEHFHPRLKDKKTVVVGRYPGLENVLTGLDVSVLERQPGEQDLPDPAAEYLLPQADWVFLTATSLINKTFPRLTELSKNAVTVLMGPSTPWLPEFSDFGIDFLAGVIPVNSDHAATIAAEGGGTRLFGDGVRYALADIGARSMATLKEEISTTAAHRLDLKKSMEAWYQQGCRQRFPGYAELDAISDKLAALDFRYKRLWDARNYRGCDAVSKRRANPQSGTGICKAASTLGQRPIR